MKKQAMIVLTIASLFFLFRTVSVYAHCEIPCGIYNDQLRIDLVKEPNRALDRQ